MMCVHPPARGTEGRPWLGHSTQHPPMSTVLPSGPRLPPPNRLDSLEGAGWRPALTRTLPLLGLMFILTGVAHFPLGPSTHHHSRPPYSVVLGAKRLDLPSPRRRAKPISQVGDRLFFLSDLEIPSHSRPSPIDLHQEPSIPEPGCGGRSAGPASSLFGRSTPDSRIPLCRPLRRRRRRRGGPPGAPVAVRPDLPAARGVGRPLAAPGQRGVPRPVDGRGGVPGRGGAGVGRPRAGGPRPTGDPLPPSPPPHPPARPLSTL